MFIVQKFSRVHIQEWKITSDILKKEKGKKINLEGCSVNTNKEDVVPFDNLLY